MRPLELPSHRRLPCFTGKCKERSNNPRRKKKSEETKEDNVVQDEIPSATQPTLFLTITNTNRRFDSLIGGKLNSNSGIQNGGMCNWAVQVHSKESSDSSGGLILEGSVKVRTFPEEYNSFVIVRFDDALCDQLHKECYGYEVDLVALDKKYKLSQLGFHARKFGITFDHTKDIPLPIKNGRLAAAKNIPIYNRLEQERREIMEVENDKRERQYRKTMRESCEAIIRNTYEEEAARLRMKGQDDEKHADQTDETGTTSPSESRSSIGRVPQSTQERLAQNSSGRGRPRRRSSRPADDCDSDSSVGMAGTEEDLILTDDQSRCGFFPDVPGSDAEDN